ncbi:MAG TPA: hypothetical protein VMY18_08730, partial [Acidobacteriota bacterium]|nr:hypothetical protein [Acidobacteriota bacterium]
WWLQPATGILDSKIPTARIPLLGRTSSRVACTLCDEILEGFEAAIRGVFKEERALGSSKGSLPR